ncbi:hypothetical protein [Natrinema altunense]|uniref:hypothetical protein n=1 Tax=Natrinema altunense TaxID=222984 RepID=UPI00126860AA|nr:hypothetical protein [Natrinema altunense]
MTHLLMYGLGTALVLAPYLDSAGPTGDLRLLGILLLLAAVIIDIGGGYDQEKTYKENGNIFLEVIEERISEEEGECKRLLKEVKREALKKAVGDYSV